MFKLEEKHGTCSSLKDNVLLSFLVSACEAEEIAMSYQNDKKCIHPFQDIDGFMSPTCFQVEW